MARPQYRRPYNPRQGPDQPASPPRVFNPTITFKNLELLARGQTRENKYDRERTYETTFRTVNADGLQDLILLSWHQYSQAGTTPNAQEFATQLNQRPYFTKLVARATNLQVDFDDLLTKTEEKLKNPEQLTEAFQRLGITGWEPNILPTPDPTVEPEPIAPATPAPEEGADARDDAEPAPREATPTNPPFAAPATPTTQAPQGAAVIGDRGARNRPQQNFKIATKDPDYDEKRLYLWHDGKLLATWEARPDDDPKIPKGNWRITKPELRKHVIPEVLKTKNTAGLTLSDRITTHQQSIGGTLVKIDPDSPTDLEATNVYPGFPPEKRLYLRDLILFNSEGKGTDRIHQRRDIIETLRKNSLPINPENAVTLCRAFHRAANEYATADSREVEFQDLTDDEVIQQLKVKAKDGRIDEKQLNLHLEALHKLEGDKSHGDTANNEINHQILLKHEELRRINTAPMDMRIALEVLRNTEPLNTENGKGWSSQEMTTFAKEAIRQSQTAEEQLTYLREYAGWISSYRQVNSWASHEIDWSIDNFNVALEAHGIGMIDIQGNGKYTAITTIGRTREDIISTATDRIAGTALINSVVGTLGTNPSAEAAKARQQNGSNLNQKIPTTRDIDPTTTDRIRFKLVQAMTKGPIKDHTGKFVELDAPDAPKRKTSLYRQFGKFLTEADKIAIAKATTKADGELLLAMAEDPLTRGELRRYLINNAPAGTLGAHIQITALREALTEGRIAPDQADQTQTRTQRLHNKNEIEAKTLIDLLHLEAGPGRNATVAELARRLAMLDPSPNAAAGQLAWQGWQAELQTPDGRQNWDDFVVQIDKELTEEQRKAKETQEIRARLLRPPQLVPQKNAPPKLVYHFCLLNGDFDLTAESLAPTQEEIQQSRAFHTHEEIIVVARRNETGTPLTALKVDRANKVITTNKDHVGDRTASVWHEIGPAAIDHLNNYLKLAGELEAIKRLEQQIQAQAQIERRTINVPPKTGQSQAQHDAEVTKLAETNAANAIIANLGGTKDETGRRIGKQAGEIEFALPEDPNNPLPGTPEEQRATKERLKKEWNEQHAEILHGLRKSDKSLVCDEDGKVINPGDIHNIIAGLHDHRLPGQLFEGTDRIKGVEVTEQVTAGELNAQLTLVTHRGKLKGHREKWDDLDREIAAANGGELPANAVDYLRARKGLVQSSMQGHMQSLQAHIRESDLKKSVDRSAVQEAAGGHKKLGELLFGNGKGHGEASLDSLGAALLR